MTTKAFDNKVKLNTEYVFTPYEFTATAGQTQFSIAPLTIDLNGGTLVDVNGLALPPSEISVSGSTVTIPACADGDEVVIKVATRFLSYGGITNAALVSTVQAGTGAVTRTVESKLREWVSVKDFGAVGDGITDDRAAVIAALNAASSIVFPSGTYVISASITLPDKNIYVSGDNATIVCPTNGAVFIRANRGKFFSMRELSFTGNGAAFRYDMGASIHTTQYFEYDISKCRFLQGAGYYAIALIGAREGCISNCYFETCDGIYASYSVNTEVVQCEFKNCGKGIYYDVGSEGLKVIGGTALGCSTMLQTWRNAGVQVVGVMWDYNDTSIVVRGCSDVIIMSSYISGRNTSPAIHVTSTGAFRSSRIVISGNSIASNDTIATANDCVLIEDSDYFNVNNNNIFNWRVRGVKTGNGCTFGELVRNNVLEKATFGTHSITTGTGDSTIRIEGNTVTKPMSITSTRSVIGNRGWTTEASGETTWSTGATSYSFPHGLAMTPLKSGVRLNQTSIVESAVRWWIGSVDATNITINMSQAPTNPASFSWSARIAP